MRATILPYAIILTKARRPRGVLWPSTASEVFLIFTTQLYQYIYIYFFFLFALVNDKPQVFLPKYSQRGTSCCHCSLPEGSKPPSPFPTSNLKHLTGCFTCFM